MSEQRAVKNRRKIDKRAIMVICVATALLLIDITPIGGNLRFYMKWSACGAKPVQVKSKPGIGWYEESPAFQPLFRNQSWYCSPIEAERAGYSASRDYYTFPNLEKAGEPNPFLND